MLGVDKPSGRTDSANASRFINEYGDRVRFLRDENQWLAWDGKVWRHDPLAVQEFAKKYAAKLWQNAGAMLSQMTATDRKPIISFLNHTNGQKGITAFLSLAKSDERIAVKTEQLDSHLHLLNCQNGVLDFRTKELQPHNPDLLITQIAPVSYSPEATCPKWQQTVDIVCGAEDEFFPGELSKYVQEVLGYCCVGGNPNAIMPIWYGDGNNGKSTLWLTLMGVLGSDYVTVTDPRLISGDGDLHPAYTAALKGKRCCFTAELEQGKPLKEATVKTLTGPDELVGRLMGGNPFLFRPTHKLIVPTNYKPTIRGTDKGIWRRIKLIPFTVDISQRVEPKKDYHLELIGTEASGILNWLLEGYQSWQSNGKSFHEPSYVTEATDEYREESDDFIVWLKSKCDTSDDVAEKVTAFSDLWDSYRLDGKLTDRLFQKRLAAQFQNRSITKGPKKGCKGYVGISLDLF